MKGLEEIFRERYVSQSCALFAVARAIVGNADDAADVVQEAMIKIWRRGAALITVDNPAAYAVSVVRTSAIDLIRSRRDTVDVDTLAALSDTDAQPDFDAADTIDRIIESLPERQQTVIRLSAYGGCPNDEISSLTGLSPDNVRQLLSRARRKLKEIYTKISEA